MNVEPDDRNRIVNCRGMAKSKGLVLGLSISALANISFGLPFQGFRTPAVMTKHEMLALPPYCPAQQFIRNKEKWPVSQAEIDKWNRVLGRDYLHLHHYCQALNAMNKAQRISHDRVRHFHLDFARRNIEYVQRNVSPTFVLLPEINVRKGYVLRFLGEHEAAAREYLAAIRLRPQYAPAYSALSDYYLDLDNREEAVRVLEDGLRQAPNSRTLKRKLSELKNPQDESCAGCLEAGR